MAIITPIGSSKPIEVAFGGTGLATMTGLAGANGTSAFTARTLTGTTNQISVANGTGATANPTVSFASTVVKSSQPAFLAHLATGLTNKTGNSVLYTIIYDTEDFDQASNFNLGTSTFTAPVTGKYFLSAMITLNNLGTQTNAFFRVLTTARAYQWEPLKLNTNKDASNQFSASVQVIADMASGATATVQVNVIGGAQTVGLAGAAPVHNWFAGYLVC